MPGGWRVKWSRVVGRLPQTQVGRDRCGVGSVSHGG